MAGRYPLGKLWTEVVLARRLVNERIAEEANMMHTVVAAVLGGKTGHANFEKALKALRNG